MTVLTLSMWLIVAGAVAGIFHGLAAVIRAWFHGRAELIRAQRGDPEPADRQSAVPNILSIRSRGAEG